MIKRDELIKYIDQEIGEELLVTALLKDDFANGVQITGSEEVKKVAIGVSLNEEFLQEAVNWGANYCIFHHGIYTPTYKLQYTESEQKRLRLIFKNDLTIAGFHYALDAHPKIGNNAQIIKKLVAEIKYKFGEEWGFTAVFDKPKDLHVLGHDCQELFDHEIFVVEANHRKVKTVGVVSGSHKPGTYDFREMKAKNVDLLITGETAENLPHQMKEEGINYFVCGHYATEVFGIQALGAKIRETFKGNVDVEFIDIKNPV